MSKLMLATAVGAVVAMTASTAMATDINQILGATQQALNSISTNNNDNAVSSQTGVNAANLIDFNAALHHVNQLATGDQTAINTANSKFGFWDELTQSATNIANSLTLEKPSTSAPSSADNVDWVNQDTSHWSWWTGLSATDQYAKNVVSDRGGYTGNPNYDPTATGEDAVPPSQSAVNAVNLVSVNDIEGGVNQNVSHFSSQTAINKIEISLPNSETKGSTSNASQVATNVANSVSASDVGLIDQRDDGPQFALNKIEIGAGTNGNLNGPDVADLLNSSQVATNVSNSATIGSLDWFSKQQSDQSQKAINVADYVNPTPASSPYDGHVGNLTQEATNATNLLTVGANGLPSHWWATEVQQYAGGSQLAKNVLTTPGALSGITQTATNIANSLSLPTND